MSVPMKFRNIGDFHEYYSGKRKAPYLTLFVGGNHEASNHLFELYYGGWVAPNIYYLGAANVVRFGPLRIAGLSGIWKGHDYNKPHYERLPYNQDDVKSIYHVREFDVRKLLQLRTQVDVGISHDWPRGIEWLGDWKALFAKKDLFEADARAGTLGSSAGKYVLDRLRPPYWFSAHLHCKFSAIVNHAVAAADTYTHPSAVMASPLLKTDDASTNGQSTVGSSAIVRHNEDEIDLDMDDEDIDSNIEKPNTATNTTTKEPQQTEKAPSTVPDEIRAQLPESFLRPDRPPPPSPATHPEAIMNKTTKFLALDKCLPNRKFLQLLTIDPVEKDEATSITRPYSLCYDKEWLAITRVFAPDLILGDSSSSTPPNRGEAHYQALIEAEQQWVDQNLVKTGKMVVPEDFSITTPVYDPAVGIGTMEQPREYTNPQTARFCELVGIPNPFDMSEEAREARRAAGPRESRRRDGPGRGGGGGGGRGQWGGRGGRGRGRGRGRGQR
jgi:lariat debranching enzyme